jgi:DNA-binding Lrp family transcriptional regulator
VPAVARLVPTAKVEQGLVTPAALSDLEKRLLDHYQRGFPLTSRPYRDIAEDLGSDETTVIATLKRLKDMGLISRIGAVVTPHRAGWSTLAAMAVPPERLHAVAELVSGFGEVNHNYEREHRLNLWFVVTGTDVRQVRSVLQAIEARTGLAVLDLPMVEAFRLDLGFALRWD